MSSSKCYIQLDFMFYIIILKIILRSLKLEMWVLSFYTNNDSLCDKKLVILHLYYFNKTITPRNLFVLNEVMHQDSR